MALERNQDGDEAFLRDLTLPFEDWPSEWRRQRNDDEGPKMSDNNERQ
jgi:hypothetical protein